MDNNKWDLSVLPKAKLWTKYRIVKDMKGNYISQKKDGLFSKWKRITWVEQELITDAVKEVYRYHNRVVMTS